MPDSTAQAQRLLYSTRDLGSTIPGQAVGAFPFFDSAYHKRLSAA